MNHTTCLKDKIEILFNMQGLTMNFKFPLFVITTIFLITSLNSVYAQPLNDISTVILESEDSGASVQLTWNNDDAVSNYEVGCVSCIPNFSESTVYNKIVLQNVTSIESGLAILYVIAYDSDDEIIVAKQILVDLR